MSKNIVEKMKNITKKPILIPVPTPPPQAMPAQIPQVAELKTYKSLIGKNSVSFSNKRGKYKTSGFEAIDSWGNVEPFEEAETPKRKGRVASPELSVSHDGDMNVPLMENPDDIEMIRKNLLIERAYDRMHIIVVAVSDNKEQNNIEMIRAGGEPLGCYAYDCNNDAYIISCKAYIELGDIPIAYRIATQGQKNNNNVISLPDELVEKYLCPQQKKHLNIFREKHKDKSFTTFFMQSISC